MQKKTIEKIIRTKLQEWLDSITDESLRTSVKNNLLVSGGSIASMFLNEKVNDYDIYIQDMNVLVRLAKYYTSEQYVLDGRNREQILNDYIKDKYGENITSKKRIEESILDDNAEQTVRLKTLKENQVKLNIPSEGIRFELTEEQKEKKYQVVFLSQNAISLSDDIQIVLRFNGTPEQIHTTFDFIHATNYFTFQDGLVTNITALESLLSKDLKYQGSHYPLTSIIRIKKFLKRGWNINAGEMLKIMFQISEIDLRDIEILEEQLIGVDIAYFSTLIQVLKNVPEEKYSSKYINEIIDRVFNKHEEIEE